MYYKSYRFTAISVILLLLLTSCAHGKDAAGGAAQDTGAMSDEVRRQLTQDITAAVIQGIKAEMATAIKKEFERTGLTQTIKDIIAAEVAKARSPQGGEPIGVGSARGRVLWNGKPLANCLVKIRRIKTPGLHHLASREPLRSEFLATTDKDGTYEFKDVPEGHYQLVWKAPQHTSWLRRLAKRADIVISKGATLVAKDLEANVRTVN